MGASIWLPLIAAAPRGLPFVPSIRDAAMKARRTSGNKWVSHLPVIGLKAHVLKKARVFLYQACVRCVKNAVFPMVLTRFSHMVKASFSLMANIEQIASLDGQQ